MTLPFWSDDPAGPPSDAPHGDRGRRTAREEPRRVTLVRLSGEIARSLAGIGRIAVEGEVHRPQKSRGGWTFFTLRDRAAQMPVVCPARHSRRCRAVGGERVLVVGSLVWGNDRGQLVLEAEEVTPVGEGAVAAMMAEIRSRLAADGLLDRPRRAVPRLPKVIGVLCGADAAVRKDIESVVAARFPGYPLQVAETTVSGPGAAFAIVEALDRLSRQQDVELVILARGGGDATALLPWSDEELCRAVAACRVPVVSAIGHESDRPLCDEVADLRCGTPSIAAHRVVPDRDQLEGELEGLIEAAARGRAGAGWPVRGWSALRSAGRWRRGSNAPKAGSGTPAIVWSGRTRAKWPAPAGAGSSPATGTGRWPPAWRRGSNVSTRWPGTPGLCHLSRL